ncbi:hypothetical protein [Sphingomonas sp.]|uniref:hypothetical protein n=1 Tax=Sphingomonas sp. TaxID=28214 RepID=UPI000DB6699D|nr:hypothetical protein [Sphingomonas sp.]PZU09539.1 MAG: hypothetical protein DI605_07590 [Sphingomonas sp.]
MFQKTRVGLKTALFATWALWAFQNAAPAFAQVAAGPAAPKSAPGEIVVNARTQTIIDSFIDDVADISGERQIPRWEGSICPGIVGLEAAQAEYVNSRIGAAVQGVGLRLDREGCDPSIFVIFTSGPERVARALAERYPITLRADGRAKLKRFVEAPAAARWITTTETGVKGIAKAAGFADPRLNLENGVVSGNVPQSRIGTPARAITTSMVVLLDSTKLQGLSMRQLGDYIAMLVLARPPLGSTPPSQSILNLFGEGGRALGQMTDFDLLYLRALYAAPENMKVNAQKSSIRHAMMKAAALRPDQ